jgi:hypothetical protein
MRKLKWYKTHKKTSQGQNKITIKKLKRRSRSSSKRQRNKSVFSDQSHRIVLHWTAAIQSHLLILIENGAKQWNETVNSTKNELTKDKSRSFKQKTNKTFQSDKSSSYDQNKGKEINIKLIGRRANWQKKMIDRKKERETVKRQTWLRVIS